MQMFRWLTRRLHHIRYHSAPRPQTVWSKAADLALAATLVLAWPATWAADRVWGGPAPITEEIPGRLGRELDGSLTAWLFDPDHDTGWPADLTPHGEFKLVGTVQKRGWPLTTSMQWREPVLTLRVFSDPDSGGAARLEPGTALHDAIDAALSKSKHDLVLAQWRGDEEAFRQMNWRAWFFSGMLWWLMLLAFALLLLGIARFGAALSRVRQLTRKYVRSSEGLCSHCGYDLRGLEFRDRCPECGELVW
jgi:hypothetical protein